MCLNFPQFEPKVANETLAYKKKKCSISPLSSFWPHLTASAGLTPLFKHGGGGGVARVGTHFGIGKILLK